MYRFVTLVHRVRVRGSSLPVHVCGNLSRCIHFFNVAKQFLVTWEECFNTVASLSVTVLLSVINLSTAYSCWDTLHHHLQFQQVLHKQCTQLLYHPQRYWLSGRR